MKINILFEFKDGPWGGGNQFLKALKQELESQGLYENNPEKADIILFNSYPFHSEYLFNKVYKIKKKYPQKNILYRVDGPISLIRSGDKEVDRLVGMFDDIFVDGIIFQSDWSKKQNQKIFNTNSSIDTTIYNAPDLKIFNATGRKPFGFNGKIKIIATSWSNNWKKGFDMYKFLDENLDFKKYEFVFVGNSPIKFKNIRHIQPLPSQKLAKELKKADIFLTASKNDPCSNSLIEALSCGLPAVVLNDGGHPEIVKNGGLTFGSKNDILEKIDNLVKNYSGYQKNIPGYDIKDISSKYFNFAKKVKNECEPKTLTFKNKILFKKMKLFIVMWKFKNILKLILSKTWK